MQITRQQLNTGWRFQDVPQPGASPTTRLPWLPAEVPGHVHLDLLRAGAIPDPFYRLNERAVAWVDETDFVYETTFHVDKPAPPHAYLVFHGLDTVADITLNGEPLGYADNMYIPHEFPVGGHLKAGEGEAGDNVLRVTFYSSLRIGRERHREWEAGGNDTRPHDWFAWGPRCFVRKAQYMYGWDWGPELLGCGLWQGVELVTVPVARITDWKYDVEFTDDNNAIVTVTVDVERAFGTEDRLLTVKFDLMATDVPTKIRATGIHSYKSYKTGCEPILAEVPADKNQTRVMATFALSEVRRWYPAGYGDPALYVLHLTLSAQDKKVEFLPTRIALRTIELIREPDVKGQGEGFKFRVNGIDVFAKGANWIPNDSFPARIKPRKYGKHLQMGQRLHSAYAAGFNMLRIWGGGLYESERFYQRCDFLGILVWQDFPYACAAYPDNEHYQEVARKEAVAAVRRIRNHPCLALWCGNNENDWFYTKRSPEQPRFLGETLYHNILPAVVAEEDPKTPYWPSSPFGGEADANDQNFGDNHNWDVWHGRGDWVHYTENDARFCSEFGFASSCGLAAWDKCLAPEDKHPHSPAVRWHDKTRKGYDVYLDYIKLHYPEPQTLEDLVYYSQINQAEALKFGVEHYRRRKGRCWGTLFWQLNDCWPTQSWAVIDSEGGPKAAYYACKKFYAPLLLSLARDGETVKAHLVNDLLTPLAGQLTWTLATFDGKLLTEETAAVSVNANAAASVASFSLSQAAGREREVYVYARFTSEDGAAAADNLLLLVEPKDLCLADPGLTVTISSQGQYDYAVTITAKRFAPYVWLRRLDNAPLAELSDNFFHLQPGETRTLTVARDEMTIEELRGRLLVRTL